MSKIIKYELPSYGPVSTIGLHRTRATLTAELRQNMIYIITKMGDLRVTGKGR
jgi:hypothetical protein